MVKGTFALTFDTELIWGSFTHTAPREFERRFPDYRGAVGGILALLERHEVSATWAVVGHVALHRCQRDASGEAHPEIVHPRQASRAQDWFADDPCTSVEEDPLWYGPDIVDAIEACPVPQEIGSHSFSHPRFGDPAMTVDMARSEVAASVRALEARRHTPRSFVFPDNDEGYLGVLREQGFRAYRGLEPRWHSNLPGVARRAARLLDHALGVPPPVARPVETLPGLWNIPGSTFLIHRSGLRRAIPTSSRLRTIRSGLRRAEQSGGVFHLWTHPLNVANDRSYMLDILDRILREAAAARAAGRIQIEPMGAIAARMALEARSSA